MERDRLQVSLRWSEKESFGVARSINISSLRDEEPKNLEDKKLALCLTEDAQGFVK
jgi:hypothetical protein